MTTRCVHCAGLLVLDWDGEPVCYVCGKRKQQPAARPSEAEYRTHQYTLHRAARMVRVSTTEQEQA